ncbi:MAG: hypothetical protein RM368_12800 [Nostoc sp. DedSLP03]|uniref:hypothetical protein n=1 Tax=Nostoc sp. DedSLP03 TaxID=3075400 RepID=UPI002AD5837D|nr:hypothetical protein [Nostoc sp. DedSLP03]MDZ7965834.1 hypothetical protein [Nostoc sp. DedSLP03]
MKKYYPLVVWRGSRYERVSALPPKSGKLACMKMKRSPRSCVTWHAYQACQVAKRANVRS